MTERQVPVVRAVQISDSESITNLLHQFDGLEDSHEVEKIVATFEHHPGSFIKIAEYTGEVAGVISLHIAPQLSRYRTWAKVSLLVVDRRYRRLHIGQALLQAAEKLALRAGSATIELSTGRREERKAAHRFYTSLGYEDTGHRSVRYQKILQPAVLDEHADRIVR